MSKHVNRREQAVNATADKLAGAYVDVQYAFVQFLTEHMIDVGRAVNNDLSLVLVLAVVGQRKLEAVRAVGADVAGDALSRACISASRIADITGIPRQTVRRKLMLLRDMGWIAEEPGRGWHVANDTARQDFGAVEARFFHRLARLQLTLDDVLSGRGG